MSDEEAEKPDERSRIRPWHVVVIFLTIPALHIASGFAISGLFDDWEKRGQFGDLFGAVNALFSGMAFAGVIVTILLQREELRLQRLELRQTREELRRSAAAQEASERALKVQADAMRTSAKLASVNSVFDIYRRELEGIQRPGVFMSPEKVARQKKLIHDMGELISILDGVYLSLVKSEPDAGA